MKISNVPQNEKDHKASTESLPGSLFRYLKKNINWDFRQRKTKRLSLNNDPQGHYHFE